MVSKEEIKKMAEDLDEKYGNNIGLLARLKLKLFPSEFEQIKNNFLKKIEQFWIEQISHEYEVRSIDISKLIDHLRTEINQLDNQYLSSSLSNVNLEFAPIINRIKLCHVKYIKSFNSGFVKKLEDKYYLHLVSPKEINEQIHRKLNDEISLFYSPIYQMEDLIKTISSNVNQFIKIRQNYSEKRQSDLVSRIRDRINITEKLNLQLKEFVTELERNPFAIDENDSRLNKIKVDNRKNFGNYWPLTTFYSNKSELKYSIPTKEQEDEMITKLSNYNLVAEKLMSNFEKSKYTEFKESLNKLLVNEVPHIFDDYQCLISLEDLNHFISWHDYLTSPFNKQFRQYKTSRNIKECASGGYLPRIFGNDLLLSLWHKYKKIIFFDVETTGLDLFSDVLLEFSFITYEIQNGKIEKTDVLDVLIKYSDDFYISESIQKLTSITNQDLNDLGIPQNEARDLLYKYLLVNKENIFIAYNTQFDIMFLKKFLSTGSSSIINDIDYIDLLYIAYQLRFYTEIKDYKLSTLVDYYELSKYHLTKHRAKDDAEVLYYLAKEIEFREEVLLSDFINLFGYYSKNKVFGTKLSRITYNELWRRPGIKKFHKKIVR